jgi:hypothetical protein
LSRAVFGHPVIDVIDVVLAGQVAIIDEANLAPPQLRSSAINAIELIAACARTHWATGLFD